MKLGHFAASILLSAVLLAGCDHSTNNEPAPKNSGVTIINPTNESFVDGSVKISVKSGTISPKRLEFYINDELYSTKTSPPWEANWETANLPSSSSHKIQAVAYNEAYAYSSSTPVLVKIK